MSVSKEALKAFRPRVESVEVEGFGTVSVRGMTVGGKKRYQNTVVKIEADGTATIRESVGDADGIILQECLCDESGKRLFGAEEMDAVLELPEEFARAVLPVARRLSGLNETEEELGKDSAPTLSISTHTA